MPVTRDQVRAIYEQPFMDLVFEAQKVHREHHKSSEVQLSTLLSIKTGACTEDCGYCAQSSRYQTAVEPEPLMKRDEIFERAKRAKDSGADRFCMGAAWREVSEKDMPELEAIVSGVKGMGLETCMTLGMLTEAQATRLRGAGLDYYNHNLDTSPEFYGDVISTRTYQDRLETLGHVRGAGMKVCSGGILGMGERREDRIGLLAELASLPTPPESVPINRLVPIEGTPLAQAGIAEPLVDPIEFVRTIATARILMPKSEVRLSAGRESMSDEMQALCFLAGANSIFFGEKLLTTPNPEADADMRLFKRLGITAKVRTSPSPEGAQAR